MAAFLSHQVIWNKEQQKAYHWYDPYFPSPFLSLYLHVLLPSHPHSFFCQMKLPSAKFSNFELHISGHFSSLHLCAWLPL